MRYFKNILVTGGCGFIGTNFINYLLQDINYSGNLINLDKLTYAGNLSNLKNIPKTYPNYRFIQGDICDKELLISLFSQYDIDCIINFAAESHVDRSILGPEEFIRTNVFGTFNLLDTWKNSKHKISKNKLFHQVSTDEVYGSLEQEGFFYETTPYAPRSPYSASKAAADHLVKSYFHTYGVPVTISNCSNNYGPFQFLEKFIPLMIDNMLQKKKLPVYGNGQNIRDWLFVKDHCCAIWQIVCHAHPGNTYNIGSNNELTNIELLKLLCNEVALQTKTDPQEYLKLITYIKDRPGHDLRYAINCDKIKKDLNWHALCDFQKGLQDTIAWYLNNQEWINNIKNGNYRRWINKNYNDR